MTLERYTVEVLSIFENNNWNKYYNSNCEKILLQGEDFSDTERDMMIYLLNKYTIIPEIDYPSLAFDMLKLLDNISFLNNKVYIIPLNPKYKHGKSNSSFFMYELFKGNIYQSFPFFTKNKAYFVTEEGIPKTKGDVLIIDDFNGSGESILKYIDELQELKIDKSRISILLLGSMKEGYNALVKAGMSVYCLKIFEKGISSITDTALRQKYIEIMKNLENCKKFDERFGHNACEGLITLKNTPNSTFPIFWDTKNNPNAPFKRL